MGAARAAIGLGYPDRMTSRVIALTITAALALGMAGSANAGGIPAAVSGGSTPSTTGTWDATHTYGVNGTKRTCTLTRGAKCVGANLRGKVKIGRAHV